MVSKIFYHSKGASPLMIALLTGHHECAAALIAAGAELDLRNSRGWRAMDFLGHSAPEFLQEAFEGRGEECQKVSSLACGLIQMRL